MRHLNLAFSIVFLKILTFSYFLTSILLCTLSILVFPFILPKNFMSLAYIHLLPVSQVHKIQLVHKMSCKLITAYFGAFVSQIIGLILWNNLPPFSILFVIFRLILPHLHISAPNYVNPPPFRRESFTMTSVSTFSPLYNKWFVLLFAYLKACHLHFLVPIMKFSLYLLTIISPLNHYIMCSALLSWYFKSSLTLLNIFSNTKLNMMWERTHL